MRRHRPSDVVLAETVELAQQARALGAQVAVQGVLVVHPATMPCTLRTVRVWRPSATAPTPTRSSTSRSRPGTTRPPLVVLLHGGFWRVAYDRCTSGCRRRRADRRGSRRRERRVPPGRRWRGLAVDVHRRRARPSTPCRSRSPTVSTWRPSPTSGTRPAGTWPSGPPCGTGSPPVRPGARNAAPLVRGGGGPGAGRRPGCGGPARPERRGGPRAARRQPDRPSPTGSPRPTPPCSAAPAATTVVVHGLLDDIVPVEVSRGATATGPGCRSSRSPAPGTSS